MSKFRHLAPLWASEMMLLAISFVSNKSAAGLPLSPSYCNLSPPIVRRTRYLSFLRGRLSQTMLAYVIQAPVGISFLYTKSIVCEPSMVVFGMPFDNLPNLLSRPVHHVAAMVPRSRLSIPNFFPILSNK